MLLFGWKYFCGIDENFFAKFLLLFNSGLTFGIQLSRWMLGTVEIEYEILSSILIAKDQNHIFWSIFMFINCTIWVIGGIGKLLIFMAHICKGIGVENGCFIFIFLEGKFRKKQSGKVKIRCFFF